MRNFTERIVHVSCFQFVEIIERIYFYIYLDQSDETISKNTFIHISLKKLNTLFSLSWYTSCDLSIWQVIF